MESVDEIVKHTCLPTLTNIYDVKWAQHQRSSAQMTVNSVATTLTNVGSKTAGINKCGACTSHLFENATNLQINLTRSVQNLRQHKRRITTERRYKNEKYSARNEKDRWRRCFQLGRHFHCWSWLVTLFKGTLLYSFKFHLHFIPPLLCPSSMSVLMLLRTLSRLVSMALCPAGVGLPLPCQCFICGPPDQRPVPTSSTLAPDKEIYGMQQSETDDP